MQSLKSSDGETFSVDRALLKHAGTIETMITNMNLDDPDATPMSIPLPNVTGPALKLVIDWLTLHKDDPVKEEAEDHGERDLNISDVDKQYLAGLTDLEDVFTVIAAANYLDVKGLLDIAIKKIATEIKGKKAEQINETFGIKRDFTPEQLAKIEEENKWCEA